MKKNPINLLSLAALAFSLCALALVLWSFSAHSRQTPAVDVYRLEKLDEMNDMVLKREIIPQDYLRYLPEDLQTPVAQYNTDTAILKNNYSLHAEGIVSPLFFSFDPPPTDPGGYLRPERYYQMVDRISTLALHRNSSDFFRMDSVLSYSVAHEGGGSYGLWADTIHEDWYVGEELAGQAEDYFAMIDALLLKFDDARTALTTNP